MRRTALALGLLVTACDGSTTTGPSGGGQGGAPTTGGAGGDSTTSAPCTCAPIPACASPADFTDWCGAEGPGPYPAVACKECGGDPPICEQQPGSESQCLAGKLWCCKKNFNPEPIPQDWHCSGTVACDEDLEACSYDETVSALSAKDAAVTLLSECQAANPDKSCGLWTLMCEVA